MYIHICTNTLHDAHEHTKTQLTNTHRAGFKKRKVIRYFFVVATRFGKVCRNYQKIGSKKPHYACTMANISIKAY